MDQQVKFTLNTSEDCQAFGIALAQSLPNQCFVYLRGNLGVGKTTLTQGILRGLGVQGAIKSPSYALVEPYALEGKQIAHIDLYRISDAEELEFIGIRDYFNQQYLCIVEWPEKAEQLLPDPDLDIQLQIEHQLIKSIPERDPTETIPLDQMRLGTLTAQSDRMKDQWHALQKRLWKWTSQ